MDGQPTYLFFVLVAPESSTGAHLKALARISRVFKDPEFRRRPGSTLDAESMYQRGRGRGRQVLRCPKSAITVGELLERAELAVSVVVAAPARARAARSPCRADPEARPRAHQAGRNSSTPAACWCSAAPRSTTCATQCRRRARSATRDADGEADPACVVVCRGLAPPARAVLRPAADRRDAVPVLVSALVTADFIGAVNSWMADRLAPSTEMHGVLMDVLGIGVLAARQERDRQERDRARSGRPRPPAGRRRRDQDPPPGQPRDRAGRRDHRPPHGDPRAWHH